MITLRWGREGEILKMFYYRGLKEWDNEKGYLIEDESVIEVEEAEEKWINKLLRLSDGY